MLAVNHQVVLVATGLPRQAYAFKAPLVARACACSLNRLTKREDAAQSRIAHVSKPVSLARHVQGKAANKTEAMPASSSTTGTSGSNGWAWLFGSLTLSSGVAAPALYIGSHWNEILQLSPANRTAGIAASDVLFIASASLFFYCGHVFGVQRNGNTPRFPGKALSMLFKSDSNPATLAHQQGFLTLYSCPMVELDGTRRAPDFFQQYVSVIILATILTPLVGLGVLMKGGEADLGLSTLGVYLLCLIVQIASESTALRLGTPMWAQVPQAYQPYRLYQLARGLALSSAVGSPAWLQTLQGVLVVMWVFNYGAQMAFTPWLYRWHLQPTDTK